MSYKQGSTIIKCADLRVRARMTRLAPSRAYSVLGTAHKIPSSNKVAVFSFGNEKENTVL